MVHYKLVYFNFRGRAEVARYVLAAAGQEYEDLRFEREDWPKHKPNAPLGQVPYLEVNDGSNTFVLSQSVAIARFLGRKFNLAGKTEQEQAEADMYGDQISDLVVELAKAHKETDEAKKAELNQKIATEILPNNLKLFEARLAKTNSGFLLASGLSWADLYLYAVLEWLGDKKAELLSHFSLVKALDEKISNHPNIKAWIEKKTKNCDVKYWKKLKTI